jgi:hypothetical protein
MVSEHIFSELRMPRAKRPVIPTELQFEFIKSNFYRVVKADGIFGGLSPNGSLHLGVYSERMPYPQKMFHKVEAGNMGPEDTAKRVGRKGILREMEVGISMDVAQAIVLRNWLDDKIKQYEQLIGPLPIIPDAPKVNTGQASKTRAGNGKRSER